MTFAVYITRLLLCRTRRVQGRVLLSMYFRRWLVIGQNRCQMHLAERITMPLGTGIDLSQDQSINQSKFIFQAMTNNYNIINVTALERLPEKYYAH